MRKISFKFYVILFVCLICSYSFFYGRSHSEEKVDRTLASVSGHAGKKTPRNPDHGYFPKSLDNQAESATKLKAKKIFGTGNVIEDLTKEGSSVVETDRLINDFFAYLDHQGYVRSHNLSGGSREQFFQICRSLLADSPVAIRETDSLRHLFENVFHFYRALGKEKIILINDVLRNESDIVEPMMRLFYLRLTAPDRISNNGSDFPTLEQLYEYVSFLMETLGGRSYLFRRDPRIRILAQYYCVLMIDEANNQGHNPNGIDIRPHIRNTMDDISDQKNLLYKSHYLISLEKLKQKYERS
jgi:hypothetical protein